MAEQKKIHFKSEKYYKDLSEYHQLLSEYTEIRQKYNNAPEKEIRALNKIINKIGKIEGDALKQYIEETAGNYELLLSDAKSMIAQIDIQAVTTSAIMVYQDILRTQIIADNGAPIEEEQVQQAIQSAIANREQVDTRALNNALHSDICGFYLQEQYDAARYSMENQHNGDFPQRTIEEYTTFTSKITSIADRKIDRLIRKAGDIYTIIFEPQTKPQDTTFTPLQAIDRFSTPNSYVSNEYLFWQDKFYQDNNGQLTMIPNTVQFDITGNAFKKDISVPVIVSINYEGDITEEGKNTIDYNKARIDAFDLAVLDAICSFIESGQYDIYISAIDGLLKGVKTTSNIRKKRQDRIILALRKLAGTRIYLDVSNDVRAFLGDDIFKGGVYDGPMLSYEGLKLVTYAGDETYIFHVKETPAVYAYSKAKKEIVTFPAMLLNTGDRAEIDAIIIKKELLKRITLLNKGQLHQTTISLPNLFSRVKLPYPTNRTIKKRKIDHIREWLNYWKTLSYIEDYTIKADSITIKPHYEKKATKKSDAQVYTK